MNIILRFVRLVKIRHTLFGLPYVIATMALAAKGMPSIKTIFWTLFCVLAAGSGAMAFNRWADARLDARNPRTSHRIIPSGIITPNAAIIFIIICFVFFVLGAYQLNKLAFFLSPVPLGVFILYVYAKRFTSLSHFFMGIAMGMIPLGTWIAVTGRFNADILFLSFGVFAWYVGFDLFYAMLDTNFFRRYRLYSIPSRYGFTFAVITARNMHLIAFFLFFVHGGVFSLGLFYFLGLIISGLMLLYEHFLVSRYGIKKLDDKFFDKSSIISIILCMATIIDLLVYGYRA